VGAVVDKVAPGQIFVCFVLIPLQHTGLPTGTARKQQLLKPFTFRLFIFALFYVIKASGVNIWC